MENYTFANGFRYVERKSTCAYSIRLFDPRGDLVFVAFPQTPQDFASARIQAKRRALGV